MSFKATYSTIIQLHYRDCLRAVKLGPGVLDSDSDFMLFYLCLVKKTPSQHPAS